MLILSHLKPFVNNFLLKTYFCVLKNYYEQLKEWRRWDLRSKTKIYTPSGAVNFNVGVWRSQGDTNAGCRCTCWKTECPSRKPRRGSPVWLPKTHFNENPANYSLLRFVNCFWKYPVKDTVSVFRKVPFLHLSAFPPFFATPCPPSDICFCIFQAVWRPYCTRPS